MAGLLDLFNNISPEQNQGLLAAAAQILQNSGTGKPFTIGQAMGTGIGTYQQTTEAARQRKMDEARQAQQDQFQQEYRTVQMDGLKSQKSEREAKMQREKLIQEVAAKSIGPDGNLDMRKFAAGIAGTDPERAAEIMKDLAPKPVTYSQPETVVGPDGKPMLARFASDGSGHKAVEGLRPWIKPEKPDRAEAPKPIFSAELGGFVLPPSASNPQGSFQALPGVAPKAAKPVEPTEGERKAATLHMRMEGSLGQLKKAVEDDAKAASPSLAASRLRAIGLDSMANKVNSGPRQRVEAAQLDLLDASLTLATGAAYTKEQLEGYRASYFPQINDDKKTIEDKEQRLQTVLKAARLAAGRAAPTTPNPFGGGEKVATLADIAETARRSGKTTAEVTAALKAKGYTIKGQ